jgi:hypothetical protein
MPYITITAKHMSQSGAKERHPVWGVREPTNEGRVRQVGWVAEGEQHLHQQFLGQQLLHVHAVYTVQCKGAAQIFW